MKRPVHSRPYSVLGAGKLRTTASVWHCCCRMRAPPDSTYGIEMGCRTVRLHRLMTSRSSSSSSWRVWQSSACRLAAWRSCWGRTKQQSIRLWRWIWQVTLCWGLAAACAHGAALTLKFAEREVAPTHTRVIHLVATRGKWVTISKRSTER